jgi:hypothetical protein
MASDALKPWHRQPSESRKAYHAFVHYRDQLSWERTIDKAYTGHRSTCQKAVNPLLTLRASPEWRAWALRFNWTARADAHDAELQEIDRQRRAREIDQMNERHAVLAVALQNQVVGSLQKLVETNRTLELTPSQLALLSDKATTIERRARGQATEILRHDERQGTGTPLDLSKLTDDELAVFERLAAKAGVTV